MGMDALEEVLESLKACITSRKGGVPLHELNDDYKELLGEDIPFRKFGHGNLQAFLSGVPGVFVDKTAGTVRTEPTANTQHLHNLISKQKDNVKKSKKRYQQYNPLLAYTHKNYNKQKNHLQPYYNHEPKTSSKSYTNGQPHKNQPNQSYTNEQLKNNQPNGTNAQEQPHNSKPNQSYTNGQPHKNQPNQSYTNGQLKNNQPNGTNAKGQPDNSQPNRSYTNGQLKNNQPNGTNAKGYPHNMQSNQSYTNWQPHNNQPTGNQYYYYIHDYHSWEIYVRTYNSVLEAFVSGMDAYYQTLHTNDHGYDYTHGNANYYTGNRQYSRVYNQRQRRFKYYSHKQTRYNPYYDWYQPTYIYHNLYM